MQINGIGNVNNRLPDAEGRQGEVGRERCSGLAGEKKALSAFTDSLLQKVEKIEESGRNSKIAAIAAELESNSYKVDFSNLAESMLDADREQ